MDLQIEINMGGTYHGPSLLQVSFDLSLKKQTLDYHGEYIFCGAKNDSRVRESLAKKQ